MKIDSVKFNTNYYTPDKGNKTISFKGDHRNNETLPVPNQDVTQFTNKNMTKGARPMSETFGKVMNTLKRFFKPEAEPAPWAYSDLGLIIYKY